MNLAAVGALRAPLATPGSGCPLGAALKGRRHAGVAIHTREVNHESLGMGRCAALLDHNFFPC
jgi:hypothetical protein